MKSFADISYFLSKFITYTLVLYVPTCTSVWLKIMFQRVKCFLNILCCSNNLMLDSKIIWLVARLLLQIYILAMAVLTALTAVMCLFCHFIMKHCSQSGHKIVYTSEKYCYYCEPSHCIGCLLEVYCVTWALNCHVSKLWRETCLGMLSIVFRRIQWDPLCSCRWHMHTTCPLLCL
jgi:hypothetical protein